jgi:LuxR family maltose regulon positive regulatory protein
LFNELLLTRLRQTIGQPGEAELRQRAAHWHNQQGHLSEAVRMALQAQDFDLAANLIENPAQSIRIWESGEVATILKWIQQLPPQIVQKHLWLRLYESRSMFYTGQAAAGDAILDEIEQAIHADPTSVPKVDVLLGVVLSHRARYASASGQVKSAILLSQQALEVLPEHEKIARSFVLPTLAFSAFLYGDVEKAARLFSDSVVISRQDGSRFRTIGALANLARVLLAQGQLHVTIRMSRAAIEEGTLQGNRLPVTGWVHLPLAEALYEQNKLAEAEQILLEGLRLVGEGQLTDYFGLMPALLARIQAASNRLEEADATMDAATASARRSSTAFSFSEIEAQQAHLWLQKGDLARATDWAEGYQHQPRSERLNEIEDIVLAEVFLASGQAEEARKLLAAMAIDAQASGRFGREITIRVLLALACQELGDIQESRNHIERALSLAEPEGCLQPFLSLGKPAASLLGTFSSQNPVSEQSIQNLRYMKTIVAAFSQVEQPAPEQWEQKSQPVDSLTPREMDVLRLLAEGLSNREIAARLFLSPNTLRVYTTNLYSKLYVHNRTQAVIRARELNLI